MNVIIITMNKITSNSARFDKLKTVFFLGLSCNFTSLVGCIAVWVALDKLGYADGAIATALLVLSFAPIFMADAVNNYTLGRIKLEQEKNWDDVQVTPHGRKKVGLFYKFYRMLSIFPAYLLAASFVATYSQNAQAVHNLKFTFLFAFILNFTRAMTFLKNAVAPRLPSFGGRSLVARMIVISLCFSFWFMWFKQLEAVPTPKLYIFLSGIFYFIVSGIMHPLPTRFSLLSPGKHVTREAFLTIELISEKQLNLISKENITTPENTQPLEKEGFTLVKHVRMPLIELPLFQMWGSAYLNENKNIMAFLFENEIKKGLSFTFLSVKNGSYIITTSFETEGVRFPQGIDYEEADKSLKPSEILKLHINRMGMDSENLSDTPWKHLENLFKSIIDFLHTGTAQRRKITKKTGNEIADNEATAKAVPNG